MIDISAGADSEHLSSRPPRPAAHSIPPSSRCNSPSTDSFSSCLKSVAQRSPDSLTWRRHCQGCDLRLPERGDTPAAYDSGHFSWPARHPAATTGACRTDKAVPANSSTLWGALCATWRPAEMHSIVNEITERKGNWNVAIVNSSCRSYGKPKFQFEEKNIKWRVCYNHNMNYIYKAGDNLVPHADLSECLVQHSHILWSQLGTLPTGVTNVILEAIATKMLHIVRNHCSVAIERSNRCQAAGEIFSPLLSSIICTKYFISSFALIVSFPSNRSKPAVITFSYTSQFRKVKDFYVSNYRYHKNTVGLYLPKDADFLNKCCINCQHCIHVLFSYYELWPT